MHKVPKININRKWCKSCGICIDFCPKFVYDKNELGGPIIARLEDCSTCRQCEYRCPDFAIIIGEEE